MCGIAGIISREKNTDLRRAVRHMSAALSHRGPDGEGFLVSDGVTAVPCAAGAKVEKNSLNYLPSAQLENAVPEAHIYFAHRRLSIIDLTDAGHQPMCDSSGKIWITFNGEIYNYPELRDELIRAGHTFRSKCDTEVVLEAYIRWGADCVHHFNGMWAFCILDLNRQKCFASRDRLGVKPFYMAKTEALFAFASEQKAFFRAGLLKPAVRNKALHDYLVNGLLETETGNFFEGVEELWPGTSLIYDLRTHEVRKEKWFDLNTIRSNVNDRLSDTELTEIIRATLDGAVRLRLRSDVEVGTCLSGGIDSSVIAMLIARHTKKPFHCFTAAFPGETFDEGKYAEIVARAANARHHVTVPTVEEFIRDFDELVYSQDVPLWDSSTYAQHRVMRLAKENGIKVVLDGQGADELFAGYHHHFTAKWNSLLASAKLTALIGDMHAARVSLRSPFSFYMREKVKAAAAPDPDPAKLLKSDFVSQNPVVNWFRLKNDLNDQLIDDIYRTRLKIFLKCEDRCSMWHSVESRTPFSDDSVLIPLLFSFRGNRKIRNGRLKFLLREAAKPYLPEMIYDRRDKKGFETPMSRWMKELRPGMIDEVRNAQLGYINPQSLAKAGFSVRENRTILKLFALARLKKAIYA